MALDFGKVAFSVSFDPTFAFPVDARSYFESYDAAVAAAADAKEAGSSESVYYYGQTLVVVENNKATFYIIQPDNTLSTINGSNEESTLTLDENQFRFNDDGNLSLVGYEDAASGQILTLGSDGKLIWSNPIDTYTKTEIDTKIAAAGHLKRVIVENEQEIKDTYFDKSDYDTYIFMVPKLKQEADKYDEYIIIEMTDEDGISVKYLEKVGSWEVNLNNYVTKEELTGSYVKIDPTKDLVSIDLISKLNNLDEKAEENYIKSVALDFNVLNHELQLKDLPMSKITGLEDLLMGKSDTTNYPSLLSSKDRTILNSLILDDDNNITVSGKVNAYNVIDLDKWISDHKTSVSGLSEQNFSTESYNKLRDLLSISSVNPDQFSLTNGQLSIDNVDYTLIGGLDEVLKQKAAENDMVVVKEKIVGLTDNLNELTATVLNHTTQIDELDSRLTWYTI